RPRTHHRDPSHFRLPTPVVLRSPHRRWIVRKRYPAPGRSEDVLAGWAVMSTPTGPGVTGDGWTILVPVKALPHAKTRLFTAASPAGRGALLLGMASDVLVACADSAVVSLVRVINSYPDVSTLAVAIGLETVPDPRATGARDPPT